MSEQSDLGHLDEESWNRLQDTLERFEKDCATSFPRDLAPYVPPANDPLRMLLLSELVRTDLELKWSKRQGVLVEFYLKDFPELAESEYFPRLLRDEMNVRLQHAAKPEMAEYKQRFPEQYPAFARLVEAVPAEVGKVAEPAPQVGRASVRSDFVVPVEKDSISDTMSGVFAMAARFKRVRKLGEGAFGEVWEAEAPGGVPVAVKRIFGTVSPKAVERERESLDLICSGKLRHPFLLQVFGWWIHNGQLHIMMELADESLDDRLKAALGVGAPGLQMSALKQVLIDAADALDFLNFERNIVHRDVKPANMLLMANRLKLCDFGLSRMSENLDMFMGRTRGAGTPVFMAPEIIRGYQSAQSDQYSLANSYFMLRTGRPVFRGKVAEIRRQHLEAEPDLDVGILNRAEQLVLKKALSKSTDDRFPNCTVFVQELIAAAEKDAGDSSLSTQESADVPQAKPRITVPPKPYNSPPPIVPTVSSPPRRTQETKGNHSPLVNARNVEVIEESEVPLTHSSRSFHIRRKWEPLPKPSSASYPKVIPQENPSSVGMEMAWRFLVVFAGTAAITTIVILALRSFGIFS